MRSAARDPGAANQDCMFGGLVDHPLASGLRIVDPIELALGPEAPARP
jgi:hypothetical protein